jgi:hypothetical protein
VSRGEAQGVYAYEASLRALRREWIDTVINPMVNSLIDRAYHMGTLPLPPLDIQGDGVWTRREPWYCAVDG